MREEPGAGGIAFPFVREGEAGNGTSPGRFPSAPLPHPERFQSLQNIAEGKGFKRERKGGKKFGLKFGEVY